MSQHKKQRNNSKVCSKPRYRPTCQHLTENDLLQLLEQEDISELVKIVSSGIKQFQVTLDASDFCSKHLQLVLKLLLKVSSGISSGRDVHFNSIMILGEVFNGRCSTFLFQLKIYVEKIQRHTDISLVCDLFEVLLSKLPETCWSVLPLDELYPTVHCHINSCNLASGCDMLSKLKSLLEMRAAIKDQHQVKRITASCSTIARLKNWDNTEYRSISIVPQWHEISTPKPPYKLRPNIVEGEYEDWMHYYDVHFRLLREDFVSPLRKGIKDYHDGKVGRNLSNLRLYVDVKVGKAVFTKAGLCYKIHFSVGPKRCNWMHSKRLIFGSLLCLSPDEFHRKMFFATVFNREVSDLQRGVVEVMFQTGTEIMVLKKLGTKFVMVESVAYFEASKHILGSLQTAEESTMPFTKYLIKNDSKNVSPPKYLDLCPKTTYNMSLIIRDRILLRPKLALKCSHTNIRENQQWPPLEDTELDESQLMAMKMALTQEIAVIQGPPGTGKTYIGLKIVQVLLKNFSAWSSPGSRHENSLLRSPILVMCLTNHALDQFLEGIMELNEGEELNLIRIGGRSSSEKMQKCNLRDVKRRLRNVPKEEHVLVKRLEDEACDIGAVCKGKVMNYHDPVRTFIFFPDIKHVISEHHIQSLQEPAESVEEQEQVLELWLGLYNRSKYEEECEEETFYDETSSEDDDSEYASANSEFDDESEDETDDNPEDNDTVEVFGEGCREEEARLIEGMQEWYKELQFDPLPIVKEKKIKKTLNIRRIVKIEKCSNYKKLMNNKMQLAATNEIKAEEIEDVNQLYFNDRWKLYMYWHSKYQSHVLKDLEEECQRYNRACEDTNTAKHNNDRYALETAHVIGLTTTGAAKYQHVLHLLKPRIVIVEEAAEVLECHIVSALNAGTQHLVLIGDHEQLRPKLNEYDLAVKYRLDVSLFERLVKNNFPHATLQNQHRMRPEIAELVHPHIYDTLHNHESVLNYPKVKGVSSDMFLICHNEPEQQNGDLSHSNQHEAQYLIAFCKHLLLQGYRPLQITILVTYTGQLLLMKNLMLRSEFEGIRISTVDNFQGEENDIILLSLVRSNKEGNIGFLREENRVCVALSRAKHGFYCIGNFDMLRRNSTIWQTIVSDMESKGRVGFGLKICCTNHPYNEYIAVSHQDFSKKSPNGGCNLDCGVRLVCGHTCTLKCHIPDPKHLKVKCKKPCGQTCPQGHKCNKLCYMECQCMVLVEKEMPECEHTNKMHCHEDPKKKFCRNRVYPFLQEHKCSKLCYMQCMVLVEKEMPECQHTNKMHCHEDPKTFSCRSVVRKVIPQCGHSQEMLCYHDPASVSCKFVLEKTMPRCGHKQDMPCHQNPMGVKCQTVVAKLLRGCGHSKSMPCHQSPFLEGCIAMCEKLSQGTSMWSRVSP